MRTEKNVRFFYFFVFCPYFIFEIYEERCNKNDKNKPYSDKLFAENSRNRFQFKHYRHWSRYPQVTWICYISKKSEIWDMTIPDCQVLAAQPLYEYGEQPFKMMTNRLHLIFDKNETSNITLAG